MKHLNLLYRKLYDAKIRSMRKYSIERCDECDAKNTLNFEFSMSEHLKLPAITSSVCEYIYKCVNQFYPSLFANDEHCPLAEQRIVLPWNHRVEISLRTVSNCVSDAWSITHWLRINDLFIKTDLKFMNSTATQIVFYICTTILWIELSFEDVSKMFRIP